MVKILVRKMKLILTNFRCYANETFVFEDDQCVLLWGDSGKGKTSIFKAIHFVLYGKEQKTTSFGAKSSKVELHLDNCVIVRTRTPNHLTVKITDEEDDTKVSSLADAAAQAYINKRYGSFFTQTCYLSQKCLDNFFTITRDARAECLRNIAIQSFDIQALKTCNKANMSSRNAQLTKATHEYDFCMSEMKQRNVSEASIIEPKFPLQKNRTCTYEEALLAIGEERKQQEHNHKKCTAAAERMKTLNAQLQGAYATSAHLVSLQNEWKLVKESIALCEEKCAMEPSLQSQKGQMERSLQMLRNHLAYLTAKEDHASLVSKLIYEKEQFEKIKQSRCDEILGKLVSVIGGHSTTGNVMTFAIDTVTKLEEEIEEIDNEISYCTQALKLFKTVTTYCKSHHLAVPDATGFSNTCKSILQQSQCPSQKELDTCTTQHVELCGEISHLDEQIRHLSAQLKETPLSCPCCKHTLVLKNNRLTAYDGKELKLQLETLKRQREQSLAQRDICLQEMQTLQKRVDGEKGLKALLQSNIDYIDDDVSSLEDTIQASTDECAIIKDKVKRIQTHITEYNMAQKQTSDVCEYLTKQCEVAQKKCVQLEKSTSGETDGMTVATLSAEIDEKKEEYARLKSNLDSLVEIRVQKGAFMAKEKQLLARLESCKQSEQSIEGWKSELVEAEEEFKLRTEKAQKFQRRSEEIEAWKRQYSLYSDHKRLLLRTQGAKANMELWQRAYACACKMEKIIIDAESDALGTFLDNLNEECDKHMRVMFKDEFSLRVKYESSGEKEAKKYYVDVDIYKNGEEVPYDSLSGGESDRCALVLFLAFNRLAKGRMLLLDECLSSLHAESVEDIVDHIKTEFSDRLCIMTLHQTTRGIFDQVVTVE